MKQFRHQAEQIEGKLREEPQDAEILLDELNRAFSELLSDFHLATDHDDDVFSERIDAQKLFHTVGSRIIEQIIDSTGASNVAMDTQPTEEEEELAPEKVSGQQLVDDNGAENNAQENVQGAWGGEGVTQEPAAQSVTGTILKAKSEELRNEPPSDKMETSNFLPYRDHQRLMQPIYSVRPMENVNEQGINHMINAITEVNERAAQLGYSIEPDVRSIIGHLHSQLDPTSQTLWLWQLEAEEPSLDCFIHFLTKRARTMVPTEKSAGGNSAKKKKVRCVRCEADHYLHKCAPFKALTLRAKWDTVRQAKLCANCFMASHKVEACPVGPCKRCNEKHNSLMCPKADFNKG